MTRSRDTDDTHNNTDGTADLDLEATMHLTDAHVRSVVAGNDTAGEAEPVDDATADALLRDILATPREGATSVVSLTRRRRGRRLALAAAAVAVGLLAVAIPRGGDSAFASWTRVPTSISDEDAGAMLESCRGSLAEVAHGADLPSRADVEEMSVVIADRRGDATYGVLVGEGWMADCMWIDEPRTFPLRDADPRAGVSGASFAPLPTSPVAPDGLSDVGRWGMGQTESSADGSPAYEVLDARVGDDVRGVVLHTAEGDVTATVAGGWAAAWWPTTMSPDIAVGPVGATLTLGDGSTREIADVSGAGQ